jgi:O-antigen ligase
VCTAEADGMMAAVASTDELRSIDRYGRAVLFGCFVVLLAGRFTLDRLGDYPKWDLRWAGAVVLVVLCIVWATVARQRTPRVGTGALLGWFLAWAGWFVLSAAWAPSGARVSDVLVDFVLLVVFVWIGWGAAGRCHPRVLTAVWWWLYLAGWVYLAGALAGTPDVQGRYSAFGGGPNVFVRIMALAFLATLVLAVVQRKRWVLIGLPAFLLGAFLSGSRGGLLALVLTLLVAGVGGARRLRGRLLGAAVVGLVTLGALALVLAKTAVSSLVWTRFVEETFQQGYDSGRSVIATRALQLFSKHVWFGTGLDGFFPLQFPWPPAEYPHNLVLASATEGGVVGLVLLLGALAAGGLAVYRRRPAGPDAIGFSLAALLLFVASEFSGDYYDSRFLWFFVGLAVVAAGKHRPDPATGAGATAIPAAARADSVPERIL